MSRSSQTKLPPVLPARHSFRKTSHQYVIHFHSFCNRSFFLQIKGVTGGITAPTLNISKLVYITNFLTFYHILPDFAIEYEKIYYPSQTAVNPPAIPRRRDKNRHPFGWRFAFLLPQNQRFLCLPHLSLRTVFTPARTQHCGRCSGLPRCP